MPTNQRTLKVCHEQIRERDVIFKCSTYFLLYLVCDVNEYISDLLLRLIVEELKAGGTARVALRTQMTARIRRTISFVVRGFRGDMMALLRSSVIANMVRTEAGTEQREMNWLKLQ